MTNREEHEKFIAAHRLFIAETEARIQELRARAGKANKMGACEAAKESQMQDCALLWSMGIRVDDDLYHPKGS